MNKSEFNKIYSEYSGEIYSFCKFKLKNKESAEDIVSEVFIQFYKSDSSQISNVRAWLYKVARNIMYDKIFNNKKEQLIAFNSDSTIDLDEFQVSRSKLEAEVIEESTIEIIKSRIQDLDSITSEVIILRIWDELSFKEIGNITDLSEDTAKKRFYRGVKELKKNIQAEEHSSKLKLKVIAIPAILAGIYQLSLQPAYAISTSAATNIANAINTALNIKLLSIAAIGGTGAAVAGGSAAGTGGLAALAGGKVALALASAAVIIGGGIGGYAVLNNNDSSSNNNEPEEIIVDVVEEDTNDETDENIDEDETSPSTIDEEEEPTAVQSQIPEGWKEFKYQICDFSWIQPQYTSSSPIVMELARPEYDHIGVGGTSGWEFEGVSLDSESLNQEYVPSTYHNGSSECGLDCLNQTYIRVYCSGEITVDEYIQEKNTDRERYLSEGRDVGQITNDGYAQVGNVNSYYYEKTGGSNTNFDRIHVFENNGLTYVISVFGDDDLYNQVLSTFQFLE